MQPFSRTSIRPISRSYVRSASSWLEGKLAIKSAKLRSAKTMARCPGSEHAQSVPGPGPEAAGHLWPHAAGSKAVVSRCFPKNRDTTTPSMTTLGTIVCLEMVWLCHEPHRLPNAPTLGCTQPCTGCEKDRCRTQMPRVRSRVRQNRLWPRHGRVPSAPVQCPLILVVGSLRLA